MSNLKFNLKQSHEAHKFHSVDAPSGLAVESAKASINGVIILPYAKILGYDLIVWAVQTARGPVEVKNGDWIVSHPLLGVHVLNQTEFESAFEIQQPEVS